MNKSELCISIANRVGMSQANVEEVLDAFVEVVLDRLADGEKVQLYGFGSVDIR
jgi:nucleoid DNA-binding protein